VSLACNDGLVLSFFQGLSSFLTLGLFLADARTEEELLAAIRSVSSKRKSVITIAHRLSTIRQSPTVAVLGGGKVLEVGEFQKLYADATSAFRQLMARQAIEAGNSE
jgi:ATP-binding cassette, subfamily B (MDR/TAP), member 1